MLRKSWPKFINGLVSSTALLLSVLFISEAAFSGTFYDGISGEKVPESKIEERIRPGQILIISELHDSVAHHENQIELIKGLISKERLFSVGMEFIAYPDQEFIDLYAKDKISEEEFLKSVKWGGDSFDFYRFQLKIPYYVGGKTIALNLPRQITSKVAKGGLESLSESEQILLPPNFEVGADSYYERFAESMAGHVPEESIQKYFLAQSLWDETMAWRAVNFINNHPNQVFVIIVGDFHVAYQDGLVARLRARGARDILSISQVDSEGLSESEKAGLINSHPKYGARADFVFDAQ